MESPFINVAECAAYLRSTPGNIYQLVHARKIPFSKVAGRLLFRVAQLDQWIERGCPATPSHSRFRSVQSKLRSLTTESTVAARPSPNQEVG